MSIDQAALTERDKSRAAILHLLRVIRENEKVRYHLGFGTQAFDLLTAAGAAINGQPLEEVQAYALSQQISETDTRTKI